MATASTSQEIIPNLDDQDDCSIFKVVVKICVEIDWDAIDAIRKIYNIPVIWTDEPYKCDYNLERNRRAYIFMYASAHSWAVSHFMEKIWSLGNFGDFSPNKTLNICSIGGGPGTDIFGVKLCMKKLGLSFPVSGTILEKSPKWQETYTKLADQLNFSELDVAYEIYDFVQEGFAQKCQKVIRQANLITIVKMISSVAFLPNCRSKLQEVLHEMKSGSVVLYIDNSAGRQKDIMDYVGPLVNLRKIYERKYLEEIFIPTSEIAEMKNYCQALKRGWPLQTLRISVSAWKKD